MDIARAWDDPELAVIFESGTLSSESIAKVQEALAWRRDHGAPRVDPEDPAGEAFEEARREFERRRVEGPRFERSRFIR